MINYRQLRFNLAKTRLRTPLVWIRHRHLRPSDVFIASYPRSGSTWLRFLLFTILSGGEADFPSVQLAIPGVREQYSAIPYLPKSGRLLQTHEFFQKEYQKAIYLIRDVRDVLISEFFLWMRKGVFDDDLNTFYYKFLYGKVNPFGFWGNHVMSWLDSPAARNNDVLFIRFEDLRQNTESYFMEILKFLGIDSDVDAIRRAIESNSIERMREKEIEAPLGTFKVSHSEIRFIRQGSSGSWADMLTPQQLIAIEEKLGDLLVHFGYPLVTHFKYEMKKYSQGNENSINT
jgi:hypothetical protein